MTDRLNEPSLWVGSDEAQPEAVRERPIVDMTGLCFEPMPPKNVLIIEDEPFVALDLVTILEELGHQVIGVARTRDEAIAASDRCAPELIISDIQLEDGSSGIDAVNDILQILPAPVIFISAFVSKLTSDVQPSPMITISKPFRAEAVKSAINQAIAFRLHAKPADGHPSLRLLHNPA